MQGVLGADYYYMRGDGIFVSFRFFRFHFHCFCGAAALLCCAVLSRSYIPGTRYIQHIKKRKSVPYLGNVLTVRSYLQCARHVTLGIIKSLICNYNNHKKVYIDLLSASRYSMYFSFLSERSRRRRPPAERIAL